jgi:pteridine reductase
MSKTALITGSSKRVGKAIAEHLAAKGWNIVIHFNTSQEEAMELEENLRQNYINQKFFRVKTDLEKEAEVLKLIPFIVAEIGPFELLINNASVFDRGYLKKTSPELFNNQMNVNFKAPYFLMRDFADHCKKGNIINLVDTRITTNKSNFAVYSLSKKALWEATKMAALEFAPEIRVNAIAPGVSIPPEGKDEDYIWNLARHIPVKEPVGLQPIIQSVDYILENVHLTGQLLFADGGENLGQNA